MEARSTTRWRSAAAAVAAVAMLALAAATSAAAATEVVRDAKFDTPYLSKHGRLDVVRATARRRGLEVTHAVTMRARVKATRRAERPAIVINSRGGKRSDYELIVFGSTVFRVPRHGQPKAIGPASLSARGRTWRYRFDLGEVPAIGAGYGWAAVTLKRSGRFADVAPDDGYAQSP